MAEKKLFEIVKGMLKGEGETPPTPPARAPRQAPGAGAAVPPPVGAPPPRPTLDALNPATILRIGRSNDGRELIMTQGLGTFLIDREVPTICYYEAGVVGEVPLGQLQTLVAHLHAKQEVQAHALHYVDLLNVATMEIELRQGKGRAQAPLMRPAVALPRPARKPAARAVSDADNPATIVRVGRSNNGGELVMTQSLGTFVVHREHVTLRYFDRGREWDVPEPELDYLIEALMQKEETQAFQHSYVDLLNVATFVRERNRRGGR